MKKNITVLTMTYNREHLLERTIKSVLAQTFSNFEYVIVNDGSTDNTAQLIEKYRKIDDRIKVVNYENNCILGKQDGVPELAEYFTNDIPYFTVIDDDDFIDPRMLEVLFELIESSGSDIVSVGSMFAYPNGEMEDKYVYEGKYTFNRIDSMKELLKREKINSGRGGKLYKKHTVNDTKFPNVGLKDFYREYRVMNNITSMTITGTPMYYCYRHGTNMSGLDTIEEISTFRLMEHLDANKIRTEWLAEKMPEIANFVKYCELSFMISLCERIKRLEVSHCFEIAEDMKSTLYKNIDFLAEQDFCTEREKEILKHMNICI